MPEILNDPAKSVYLSVLLIIFLILVFILFIKIMVALTLGTIEYFKTKHFPIKWYVYIDIIVIALCVAATVMWI
jgi:hypothetical protein